MSGFTQTICPHPTEYSANWKSKASIIEIHYILQYHQHHNNDQQNHSESQQFTDFYTN